MRSNVRPRDVVPLLAREIDAASIVKQRLQMNLRIRFSLLFGVRSLCRIEKVLDDFCSFARSGIRQFRKLLPVRMPDQQKRITFRDLAERSTRVTKVPTLVVGFVLVRNLRNCDVSQVFDFHIAPEDRAGSSHQDR